MEDFFFFCFVLFCLFSGCLQWLAVVQYIIDKVKTPRVPHRQLGFLAASPANVISESQRESKQH